MSIDGYHSGSRYNPEQDYANTNKYVDYATRNETPNDEDKMEFEELREHQKPLTRLRKRQREDEKLPAAKRPRIDIESSDSWSNGSEDDSDEDLTMGGMIVPNDFVEYEDGYAPKNIEKPNTRGKKETAYEEKLREQHEANEEKRTGISRPSIPGLKFKSIRLLNNQTEEGRVHVVGRDDEEKLIFRMLAQPNGLMNPLLLGPSGIGKKSIIRKLSRSLQQPHCPKELQGRSICLVDSVSLLANELAEYSRQELAVNLRRMIEKIIKEHKNPIFYFRDIDKLFEMDTAADYLSALFLSSVLCIASISTDNETEETQKTIKKLKTLKFEPIVIDELPKEDAKLVVESKLKKHPLNGGIKINDEAIQFAIDSSHAYLKSRHHPVKALNLIHEAAINTLLEQENPKTLSKEHIAEILQEKTGIAAEEFLSTPFESLARIKQRLLEQVIGQEYAVNVVCEHINNYKMGLSDKSKPVASLLFVGPSGVGKTELAKCTAKELFQSEKNMIRIDMSEYAESHTISRLIGSPPGYVGHESGGQLCKVVRENPHCVILLDEIEKAHAEVRRVLLQLLDEGRLTDGRGETVDFTNAFVVMTSNLGAQELFDASKNKHLDETSVIKQIEKILVKELSPELYNRLQPVPFSGLRKDQYPTVIEAHLKKIQEKFSSEKAIHLKWDNELGKYFLRQDFDPKFGMRALCKFVEKTIKLAIQKETFAQQKTLKGEISLVVQNNEVVAKSEAKVEAAPKGRATRRNTKL